MNVESLARKASGWFVCIGMIGFSTAINAEHKNLDLGKPAIQSSSYCNYGCASASRAVDGNMVPERLSNFRVSILNKSKCEVWGQDFYTDGGYPDRSLNFKVPNMSGQFVQVQLRGKNYLSLAEVQVYELTP